MMENAMITMVKNREKRYQTLTKFSSKLFLASTLSLSMFPNGKSGKIFFGPLTSIKTMKSYVRQLFQ